MVVIVCVEDIRLSSYSKLLLASQDQVLGLLAEERATLQSQLKQEQDDPQACFVQSALLQLQVTGAHLPVPFYNCERPLTQEQ